MCQGGGARAWAVVMLASLPSMGCASLNLRLVDASVRKPANVALYFTAVTSRREPVPDLLPPDFVISEDGKPISEQESGKTLLQQEVAAEHLTLLLVDMSGSVRATALQDVLAAAHAFVDRVAKHQVMAVYAFDGGKDVYALSEFGADPRQGLAVLASFAPKDPSTNLNGAVLAALDRVERRMETSKAPLRFGTLVVFTDGTDRAGRTSHDQLQVGLDLTNVATFVIAVGAEINDREIAEIGRAGHFVSHRPGDVAKGFDDVARRVEGFSKSFYLLSYCSPARAGEHTLTIDVKKHGLSGRLAHRFDATGFGPGCDASRKPDFNLKRPRKNPFLPADDGPPDAHPHETETRPPEGQRR